MRGRACEGSSYESLANAYFQESYIEGIERIASTS